MLYLLTFLLGFCTIVYELLLGQSLSAFMGNTVLRYSVTIGLYMLSMGVGSLLAEGRFVKDPVVKILRIELALTLIGGFSVPILHFINWLALPLVVFSALAHALIVAIGVLTGCQIPLLIEVRSPGEHESASVVLGMDYLGAFVGAVAFAFVFFPGVGILATGFGMAVVNALAGILLVTQARDVPREQRREYGFLIAAQAVLGLVVLACLGLAGRINEFLIRRYLES